MALFLCTKAILPALDCYTRNTINIKARGLLSKQLYYYEFGDPLHVVKFREEWVPAVGDLDVLVRMLAAPINPADVNTILGRNYTLPKLPTIPGDEGVGDVLEIGKLVSCVKSGQRVVISSKLLGTWRYYGVYDERDVFPISRNICLAEAAMLSVSPCSAYRMLKDFLNLRHGETIVQTAANSPVGQCVIQLCKEWEINTINIVSSQCEYDSVKDHLLKLGATIVCTLEEAETLVQCNKLVLKPVLALNCLGGRYESVALNMLAKNGVIVYYGCAFDLPRRRYMREDVQFCTFHLSDWDHLSKTQFNRDAMYKDIINLIVAGKFQAPVHEPVVLQNFKHALKNTAPREAFCKKIYLFDFSIP